MRFFVKLNVSLNVDKVLNKIQSENKYMEYERL